MFKFCIGLVIVTLAYIWYASVKLHLVWFAVGWSVVVGVIAFMCYLLGGNFRKPKE